MKPQFQQAKQPSQVQMLPILDLLNNGQMAQAEAAAAALLKSYPDAMILHNVLANALAGQGKYAQAAESFGRLVAGNPRLAVAHFNLGTALQAQGKWDEATGSYRRAIQLQQGFFEAHGNLGVVLQEQGRLEEAIASYRKGLAINANDARGHFNLGTALRNQGKLDEAIASYRKAIALFPNYVDAYCNLGAALFDLGKPGEALDNYYKALAISPNHAGANYKLGVFLYDSGELAHAIPYFERSKLDDWRERILYCLYKSGKYDEFKARLQPLIAFDNTSPFLATLSAHYAANFGVDDPYNFCKTPLDFVSHGKIDELAEPNSSLLADLLRDINFAEIARRKQGRLHHGVQSSGNLFKRPEASFKTLSKLIQQKVEAYRTQFQGQDCVYMQRFPQDIEFSSSWYVKMSTGGYLTSHIHESGWLSGSVYLSIPQHKSGAHDGSIELSTHGDNYPQKHTDFPIKTIAPKVGDIVMFPSSLFHRTIPFNSDEERVCVAFDVAPVL